MLTKVIAIKNVGRFRNSAVRGNPQLAKHTFIVGANGYGKTTICAVLRSLKTGEASHILGRKTLGTAEASSIELLIDTCKVRFDGTNWSAVQPAIAIFDDVFVAENVHSGAVVEIGHKRNLYRVIIGDDGVRLAEEAAELAAASRAKTGEISTAARAIQPHVPSEMPLATFIALSAVSDIDAQIEQQTQIVEAVRQAGAIRGRAALSEFSFPALPEGFADLLSRTIDDVAENAERLISVHLSAHGMAVGGGNWIATGTAHAKDTCPFCGQDIRGLPLIAAFRAVFSRQYKALRDEIAARKAHVVQLFGDAALARLDIVAEQNKAGIEFWSRYCTFESTPLALLEDVGAAARDFGTAALTLLDRKAATPLEAIEEDDAFTAAQTTYDEFAAVVEGVNNAIRAVNVLIVEKKAATAATDIRAVEDELIRLRAVKMRHSDAVARLCDTHDCLVAEKYRIDRRKEELRTDLNAHTETVVKPYERRINDYLASFHADFSITETQHAYPGGIPTSSYQLVDCRRVTITTEKASSLYAV